MLVAVALKEKKSLTVGWHQVLSSMGLQAEVPLCSIKLAPPDAALLQINSDDLLHLPRTPQVRTHSRGQVNALDICGP